MLYKNIYSVIGLIGLLVAAPGVRADASADQLEQARLLRELRETRPGPDSTENLPGAGIEEHQGEPLQHRQQFEDSQWRTLLGAQQAQTFAPAAQAHVQSQWRSQTFDRERRAQDLSADILSQSRKYLSSGRR